MSYSKISCLGKETIYVGIGFTDQIPADLITAVKSTKFALVTDENIAKIHLDKFKTAFKKHGIDLLVQVLPAGEQTKCRAVKEKLENFLLSSRCGRDTCLLALGGGVIGDLTGYVAATFLRGVPFVQIPTSLLAMVDSSVGGKTGVDTIHGKNLIGAFHQPARVYIDMEFLQTLPERQLWNGMAEVVKTAAIWNSEAFRTLETEFAKVARRDPEMLRDIIYTCVSIKAEVVTKDEKESGLRELLNFGHSIGHAVEALMQPGMLHGEAVAIGMVKEAELARHLGILSASAVGRLVRCIQAYHLPVHMPELETSDLLEKMTVDKKNKGGKKYVTLLECIGRCHQSKAIPVEDHVIEFVLSPSVVVNPPPKPVDCTITVPGSKSASNRALLMAALAEGQGELHNLLYSDDTQVMMDALVKLGACAFEWTDGGDRMLVRGNGGELHLPDSEIYIGNAGTASRFLATVCTHITEPGYATLVGDRRMNERPIGPLVEALRGNGCDIEYLNREGCLPLKIGTRSFKGGKMELCADVSSQYVSAVLISAPYAEEEVHLKLVGTVVSPLYIDMTVQMMRQFGAQVEQQEGNVFVIKQQKYKIPEKYHLECDASSSSYPLCIAAITGGRVTVENVGSSSVQPDAQFCKLLARMGCTVEQTASRTIVQGPKDGRLIPVEVDMGNLTDAFMGTACLMAVTPGTSRIFGIANQRVKECDRIAAMAQELGKCGVKCEELTDGLIIHGMAASQLQGAEIQCHSDHRIAMSFAVLGCKVPGITIKDKNCVEKTYPQFWDDLSLVMGIPVTAAPLPDHHSFASSCAAKRPNELEEVPANKRSCLRSVAGTVVLIGMRAAGKTTLGMAAAKSLGWKCLDLDHLFNDKHGPIKEFVAANGWDKFRIKEAELLADTVRLYPTRCIVICGGGIVETIWGRDQLKKFDKVVEIRRDFQDLISVLTSDASRPTLGEPPASVFSRRDPWYVECSRFQFNTKGSNDLGHAQKEMTYLMKRITGDLKSIDPSRPSYFLALTFSNYAQHATLIPQLLKGCHAVEARIDLLESQDKGFIADQLSVLRHVCDIPIIYTVRTIGQGGKFPEDEDRIFDLLRHGVRLGCEYVDMETCWSVHARRKLMANRGISRIIASYHDIHGRCSWPELRLHFLEGSHKGEVDVVKVVGMAHGIEDVFAMRQVVAELEIPQPVIALCMGEVGRLSRVLNGFLTPVTHPSMPFMAAPGQLTIPEIHHIRHSLGLLPKRHFYLFGHPISQSMSPTMHNTGFKLLGLPHQYSISESSDIEHVRAVLADPHLGGASVTIPHKQEVQAMLHELSPAATAIGAVNTIIPRPDGTLYGENTDWLAMRDLIQKKLEDMKRFGKVGIVLGAGGTARAAMYMLQQMGLTKYYIYNRTLSKAEELAKEFGGIAISTIEGLAGLRDVDIVVGTIPAGAQSTYPTSLFINTPVTADMAYRPRRTPLLQQAEAAGCVTIEGIDLLIEQGLFQFEMWTGCIPPREEITQAVYRGYGE